MQKIKIRLPATVTNIGPGIQSLGLALSLYTTVEVSRRDDNRLNIEFQGEGASHYDTPLKNPVTLGLGRFFQRMEKAVLGIDVRIKNDIPLNSGLGAEQAMMVAGLMGANDLMKHPYNRFELMEIAAEISDADNAITALLGGLTTSYYEADSLLYRGLTVTPFKIIVVVPEVEDYQPPELPENAPFEDVLANTRRLPLLIEAFRKGELDLLTATLTDKLYNPLFSNAITGYGHVMEIGKHAGAMAITVSGDGPTLLAFAENNHERIAEDMRLAFKSTGVEARSWVLPIDTQGVVISAMHSV